MAFVHSTLHLLFNLFWTKSMVSGRFYPYFCCSFALGVATHGNTLTLLGLNHPPPCASAKVETDSDRIRMKSNTDSTYLSYFNSNTRILSYTNTIRMSQIRLDIQISTRF